MIFTFDALRSKVAHREVVAVFDPVECCVRFTSTGYYVLPTEWTYG